MTKGEIQTIRNIITRLKKENIGCSHTSNRIDRIKNMNIGRDESDKIEAASRIYINTWLIGPLELLLPETRDIELARRMSGC